MIERTHKSLKMYYKYLILVISFSIHVSRLELQLFKCCQKWLNDFGISGINRWIETTTTGDGTYIVRRYTHARAFADKHMIHTQAFTLKSIQIAKSGAKMCGISFSDCVLSKPSNKLNLSLFLFFFSWNHMWLPCINWHQHRFLLAEKHKIAKGFTDFRNYF